MIFVQKLTNLWGEDPRGGKYPLNFCTYFTFLLGVGLEAYRGSVRKVVVFQVLIILFSLYFLSNSLAGILHILKASGIGVVRGIGIE